MATEGTTATRTKPVLAWEDLPIPKEWALDPDGNPTTDPEIALKRLMAPSDRYKGVGVGVAPSRGSILNQYSEARRVDGGPSLDYIVTDFVSDHHR